MNDRDYRRGLIALRSLETPDGGEIYGVGVSKNMIKAGVYPLMEVKEVTKEEGVTVRESLFIRVLLEIEKCYRGRRSFSY